jgi:hypothetical protein
MRMAWSNSGPIHNQYVNRYVNQYSTGNRYRHIGNPRCADVFEVQGRYVMSLMTDVLGASSLGRSTLGIQQPFAPQATDDTGDGGGGSLMTTVPPFERTTVLFGPAWASPLIRTITASAPAIRVFI